MIRLSWLISLAISFFGMLIVGQLFLVQPKGATGNLGFIGMIFLIPFLLLSLLATFRYFATFSRSAQKGSKMSGMLLGVLLIAFFSYFFLNDEAMEGLDEKTSQAYLNFYIFGLIHSISGVLGIVYGILKPIEITESIEEEDLHE